MKIPKTPVEFDYDLWTTEDGKCMVRVKLTGEVTEVDRDVMRTLRAEEKKLRRAMSGTPIVGAEEGETESVLSTSYVSCEGCEDLEGAWLEDPENFIEEVTMRMMEDSFQKELTPREQDVYNFCIRQGKGQQEYAKQSGLSVSRVSKIIAAIRKKAKIFF